jgi:hypothetical protein
MKWGEKEEEKQKKKGRVQGKEKRVLTEKADRLFTVTQERRYHN